MQIGLEPHDLGQLSSPSSSSLLCITPTMSSAKTGHLERASICPRHTTPAAPSPSLFQTPIGFHMHLATQDKSVPFAVQPWGADTSLLPEVPSRWAESQEGKWAECPVGDAKRASLLLDSSYTPLKHPCSGALSSPRVSRLSF